MADDPARGLGKAVFRARYSVLQLLGTGAYGKVFLARQNSLARLVAIKFFAPRRFDHLPEDSARFLRETRLLAGLSHPNVVPVFDANLVGNSRFVVTEYLDGGDLANRLVPGQPLDLTEGVSTCTAVADALDYLHGQRIVHRDLKPENVLLGSDGTVKVSDFGLARPVEAAHELTARGTVVGTPAYLAPEAMESGEFLPASDVYALGILLYRCFDGRYPFDLSRGLHALWLQKMNQERCSPRACVPRQLLPLMAACLARDPALRPTARKVRDALVALGPGSAAALASASPQARRHGTERLDVSEAEPHRASLPLGARAWPAALAGFLLVALALISARQPSGLRPAAVLPVPVPAARPPARPAAPALVPAPVRFDEALFLKLHRMIRPHEIDWKIHAGVFDLRVIRQCVEKSEVRQFARLLLSVGPELPTTAIGESMLGKCIVTLQSLRLAAGKLRAHGLELAPEYEALANAAVPQLLGPPPGAKKILGVFAGRTVEVPSELVYLLPTELTYGPDKRGETWRLPLPPALLETWKKRGPRRLWWVLQVRRLNLRCVLDLHVPSEYGTMRFPFVASQRPVTDAAAEFSGVLSLGIDSRILHRLTSPLYLTYLALNGRVSAGPVVEKLELWE